MQQPRVDEKKKAMSAEEFIRSLRSGKAPAPQAASPAPKWPRRMPELIGDAPAQIDPTLRGLGALGRWMAPQREADREIKYR